MNLNRLADAARTRNNIVPGLAPTPSLRAPNRGATTTNLANPKNFAVAANQPSLTVRALPEGGVETVLVRKFGFPNIVDDQDAAGVRREVEATLRQMVNQSQGTLSSAQQRRMGHPYGRNAAGRMRGKLGSIGNVRGARGSVGNLNVVNKQSGEFARSWVSRVDVEPTQIEMRWINTAPYAEALALGTKAMAAHGPFTSAPLKNMQAIDKAVRAMLREAYNRKSSEAMRLDVARSLGMI